MSSDLLKLNQLAPEFEIEDLRGNVIRLRDFHRNQPVVLSFLRGFM